MAQIHNSSSSESHSDIDNFQVESKREQSSGTIYTKYQMYNSSQSHHSMSGQDKNDEFLNNLSAEFDEKCSVSALNQVPSASPAIPIVFAEKPTFNLREVQSLCKGYYLRLMGHDSGDDNVCYSTSAIVESRKAHIARTETTYRVLFNPGMAEIIKQQQESLTHGDYKPPIVFIPSCGDRINRGNLWDGMPINKETKFDSIKSCIKIIVMNENDYIAQNPLKCKNGERNIRDIIDQNGFILIHNEDSIVLIRECIKKFAELLKDKLEIDFDYYLDIDDDLNYIAHATFDPKTRKTTYPRISDVDGFIKKMIDVMNSSEMNEYYILSLRAHRNIRFGTKQMNQTIVKSTKCEILRLIRLCDQVKNASHVTGQMLQSISFDYDSSTNTIINDDIKITSPESDKNNDESEEKIDHDHYRKCNRNIFTLTINEWKALKKLRSKMGKNFGYQYLFQGEDFGICENLMTFQENKGIIENKCIVRGHEIHSAYLYDYVPIEYRPIAKHTRAGTIRQSKNNNCNSKSRSPKRTDPLARTLRSGIKLPKDVSKISKSISAESGQQKQKQKKYQKEMSIQREKYIRGFSSSDDDINGDELSSNSIFTNYSHQKGGRGKKAQPRAESINKQNDMLEMNDENIMVNDTSTNASTSDIDNEIQTCVREIIDEQVRNGDPVFKKSTRCAVLEVLNLSKKDHKEKIDKYILHYAGIVNGQVD